MGIKNLINALKLAGIIGLGVASTGCDPIKNEFRAYDKACTEKIYSELDEYTTGIRRTINPNEELVWNLVTEDLNDPKYKGLEALRIDMGINQHTLSGYYISRGLPEWDFQKDEDSYTTN